MVCLLIPAALATSESVIDDQSRISRRSRMPSRIESRSSTRDASAYDTRGAVRRSRGALTPATVMVIARVFARPRPVISHRFARQGRSRTGHFDHLEVRLGRAAIGTAPVLRNGVPPSPGGDAVLRPPLLLVVLESTLHADEQLVLVGLLFAQALIAVHLNTPIASKSTFSRTAQSGQHHSSGTTSHAVPAGNPSRGAPLASS